MLYVLLIHEFARQFQVTTIKNYTCDKVDIIYFYGLCFYDLLFLSPTFSILSWIYKYIQQV